MRRRRSPPSRKRRYSSPDRYPTPAKQRPIPCPREGVYSGCVFCSDDRHFSAECPSTWKMSRRVHILFMERRCYLCLKRHCGRCLLYRRCGICGEPTHHQAVCLENREIRELDIDVPESRFYAHLKRIFLERLTLHIRRLSVYSSIHPSVNAITRNLS